MVKEAVFFVWTTETLDFNRAYDHKVLDVGLDDRALVILRTNVSEVSHSNEAVQLEVFAEPDSQVCIFGSSISGPESTPKPQGKRIKHFCRYL